MNFTHLHLGSRRGGGGPPSRLLFFATILRNVVSQRVPQSHRACFATLFDRDFIKIIGAGEIENGLANHPFDFTRKPLLVGPAFICIVFQAIKHPTAVAIIGYNNRGAKITPCSLRILTEKDIPTSLEPFDLAIRHSTGS